MPLFISDEEFDRCSHDASLVAEKADSFIRELRRQLETVKAQADAASITSEQTCALLEQKYISLSSDFAKLESQNAQLTASIEQHLSDLAQVQSEKHQLHLKEIGKDGEIERLSIEASELHKSKRQLLEMLEQKDIEISEKNATIKSYFDKIINLTDAAALKQAYLHDKEADLARSHAACTCLTQEKELIERHNVWLNEELTAKAGNLVELRKTHTELQADMSTKLADAERQFNECSSSLKWNKERVKELEVKLMSLQEEFCSSKEAAAANEERFFTEVSTVTKLVELYKETSEEWSSKAGELEGVIKALEMHLSQVESDYKEKLQKEVSARMLFEKETADLKEKLDKCEAEIENYRKANESRLLPISSFTEERFTFRTDSDEVNENNQVNENNRMLVPKVPIGVSGTALAASLLRDGWSLAKMYEKYQEAVDALRHESLGRKQSQAILERVLFEIEEKAELILDERAEHERMVDAYSLMDQKLQQSVFEQVKLERTVQGLKADLKRSEREYDVAQKEIVDLQKQVTCLLKECRDIQLRCGSAGDVYADEGTVNSDVEMNDESDTERVISERLLTFRDINGLVEQNVQLRSLVRSLSDQNEKKDTELREKFEMELQKQADEAATKVEAVLKRAEEQGQMIESLHSSVAMYKRLYDEELKLHASHPNYPGAVSDYGRKDLTLLLQDSQDASKKAHDQAVERAKNLEEELDKSRDAIISLRLERDKLAMEANFTRERLDSFSREFEHQRGEINGVLARNVEFSQLIVDYQRKVRESSDSLHAVEELSRKLTMEVSLLKHEKELLMNSEKRACDEVRSLSERVHRLQASLDTIHSTEEVREEARAMEKRKQEDYLKQVERDWAQVKKELQEERDNVRTLTLDREHTVKNAMRQVEQMGKELADALRTFAAAESRAAVAEARCSDLEAKIKSAQDKVVSVDGRCDPSNSLIGEGSTDLPKVKEEMEKLREEAQANKAHMLQYKNIAQVNEVALKQIESAHEKFRDEADKMKKSLEAEIRSLQERISEIESDSISKTKEAASTVSLTEEALSSALAEITSLKEENSIKVSQVMGMEIQISSLKENLGKEHQRWQTAQNNYERQVILQSETIQELTKTSQALAVIQDEVSKLRKLADTQKSENDILKAKLESEKSVLGQLKDEAESKYKEVNEQNKILHTRMEALHIKLAEKERHYAGTFSGSTHPDSHTDSDLQTVVNYLRRSKEIAETEISLLKQEKLRLQSQLESALKSSETVQAQLHAERANSRALLFSDEDFRSLQIQVREVNLLRESNLQLREENKHNFEECQKLRELAQKERIEIERLETLLRERQIEVDACQKEIEMQKIEKEKLENRIVELLGTCKNIDLEYYNRMKDDFPQMQVKLREIEIELDETRKFVSEKDNAITCLEQDLANARLELIEREKRINHSLQVEATRKLDAVEKQKKMVVSHLKVLQKKVETLTKEKEELNKEKQSLTKQLEDSKQGKKPIGDTSSEQTMKEMEKEKDTRIQILEKTLEREREDLRKEREEHRKERNKRQKTEKTVWDLVQNVTQEKKKLVDELERHKHARDNLSESGVVPVSQSSETLLDNQTASYLQAVENLEEAVNSTLSDGLGGRAPPSEITSTMDTSSTAATARQVPAHALPIKPSTGTVQGPSQAKRAEERDKRSNLPKPNIESRKIGRRLVRPRLGHPGEHSGDTEMPEVEGSSNTEGKLSVPLDAEHQGDLTLPIQQSARKRLASFSGSEMREESYTQPDTNSIVVPPLNKKSRGSDSAQEGAEGQLSVPPQNLEPPSAFDESNDASGDQLHAANELSPDAEKDEVHTTSDPAEELKETSLDAVSKGETQNELNYASEELFDNTRETEEVFDEGLKDGDEQDPHQTIVEVESDREEGELPPDVAAERDGGDVSLVMTSPEPGEAQLELDFVPDVPTSVVDEEVVVSTEGEAVETPSSEILIDEKNDMGEGLEEMAEDSDRSNNGNDQGVVETEQIPEAAFGATSSSSLSNPADPTVSNQGSLSATPEIVEGQESPAERSTTINLYERARTRAAIRQSGRTPQTINRRGRGYSIQRDARGGRGRRGGRGQASDEGQG